LNALKAAILAHEQDFVSALNADFAHRSREETLMFDVGSTLGTINYLLRHLSRWMRPEPCDVALIFQPSTNRVVYQPLGVVGVVSPWNYPVGLALIPLATALAVGNRVSSSRRNWCRRPPSCSYPSWPRRSKRIRSRW